jgi:hypothetical protein
MTRLFLLKFFLVFYFSTIGCTIAWEAFVDGKIYDCTDPLAGYLTPDGWVGANNFPVVVVKHVVTGRSIANCDEIKEGWTVTGLWCLWSTFFAGSLIASFLLAKMSWPSSLRGTGSSRTAGSDVYA